MSTTRKSRRTLVRRVGALALAGAVLAGVGTLSTSAVFTDRDTVAANGFASGNVDLTTAPTSALFNASGLQPGDVVVAPITVANTGSLSLRYALKSTTTENSLASVLQMTVRSGVSSCTVAGFASSGTVISPTAAFGATSGVKVFGDATQGQNGTVNASGADRVLGPNTQETLCVQVVLPTSAPDSVQGVSTSGTFAFEAEQTVNNA